MSDNKKYDGVDVAKELARDLVGLNFFVLRKSFGHGVRLAEPDYQGASGYFQLGLLELIHDKDVKEIFVGSQRKHENLVEVEIMRFLRESPRKYSRAIYAEFGANIHRIIFR